MYEITNKNINDFENYMKETEKSIETQEQYLRNVKNFLIWNKNIIVNKEIVLNYKTYLTFKNLSCSAINCKIASLNSFFIFMGWNDLKTNYIRIQKKIFREEQKELTQAEYQRLVNVAYNKKNERLALIIQTICSTGIRVSELKYITVEMLLNGNGEVESKGKIRTIFLPHPLQKKLKVYVKKQNITKGSIFITKNGTVLNRRYIWKEMKQLCLKANVDSSKVFPHNLRHLFAIKYYKLKKDVVRLADLLGHSSINTTRIYLMTTGREHIQDLDRMRLVC